MRLCLKSARASISILKLLFVFVFVLMVFFYFILFFNSNVAGVHRRRNRQHRQRQRPLVNHRMPLQQLQPLENNKQMERKKREINFLILFETIFKGGHQFDVTAREQ